MINHFQKKKKSKQFFVVVSCFENYSKLQILFCQIRKAQFLLTEHFFKYLPKGPMYGYSYSNISKHIDIRVVSTYMQNHLELLSIEFASCEKLETKNSVFDGNSAEANSYCLLAVGFLLLCPIYLLSMPLSLRLRFVCSLL